MKPSFHNPIHTCFCCFTLLFSRAYLAYIPKQNTMWNYMCKQYIKMTFNFHQKGFKDFLCQYVGRMSKIIQYWLTSFMQEPFSVAYPKGVLRGLSTLFQSSFSYYFNCTKVFICKLTKMCYLKQRLKL